jgi:virginiamycin A acetyltransferase
VRLVKLGVKRLFQGVALVIVLPAAILAVFGRLKPVYTFFAQCFALGPGMPGSYLRAAYYKLTLRDCSIDVTLSFGTYFVEPDTSVGPLVAIGSYGVIGRSAIGRGCQIASHVLIPSGRRQHVRNPDGSLSNLVKDRVMIGADCWIGDAAVVMSDLGDGATVGAGSVVTKPVPPHTLVVGNPARPLPTAPSQTDGALEAVTPDRS